MILPNKMAAKNLLSRRVKSRLSLYMLLETLGEIYFHD